MKQVAILCALALGACATHPLEPKIVYRDVSKPVRVPCVPDNLAAAPSSYADDDDALKAAPGAGERYQLLTIGREQRKTRLSQTEPVIEGCR